MGKKARLVIEFDSERQMDIFAMTFLSGAGVGDLNIRKMDSLDFKKMHSTSDYFIVKRHSQIPESLRRFESPL